jgi:glutamate/aspartate transport system permease protein
MAARGLRRRPGSDDHGDETRTRREARLNFSWQNWEVFLQDPGDGRTYLQWMLSAWGWTLAVAGGGLVIALVVGSLMGILRTTPNKALVLVGEAWTELFRNIPLLVQLFLWYHVLPSLLRPLQQVPSFLLVVFALGFFTSARVSEQVKAGIQALPRGQRYAGLAMGLTLPQTYRYVLLPMAYRIVIPPLTSESMNIIKNSSVAFAVSVAELTMFAMQAQEETSRGIEIYLAVTVLYFISAFAVNRLALLIEHRLAIPGTTVAKGGAGGH